MQQFTGTVSRGGLGQAALKSMAKAMVPTSLLKGGHTARAQGASQQRPLLCSEISVLLRFFILQIYIILYLY